MEFVTVQCARNFLSVEPYWKKEIRKAVTCIPTEERAEWFSNFPLQQFSDYVSQRNDARKFIQKELS